jgi:hypothetical protein
MGSPPVAAAAALWRGGLVVKCTVFGMMAVKSEGFKLLTLQFLDFKIVRILYLHMLCSDNFIFRCCTATTISSDVQLHNNFFRSDVQVHNNFFRCCAAQQFLQLCSNNNFFRCAKLNISEEIEN